MDPSSKQQEREQLIASLAACDFADRYYELCGRFETSGAGLPVEDQRALIYALGRSFAHDKRENFFGHRETATSEGIELGLNLSFRDGMVEAVLVCATPSGHVGGTFAGLALEVKRRDAPQYKHSPAYPRPKFANKEQAAQLLSAVLKLYDAIRSAMNPIRS